MFTRLPTIKQRTDPHAYLLTTMAIPMMTDECFALESKSEIGVREARVACQQVQDKVERSMTC